MQREAFKEELIKLKNQIKDTVDSRSMIQETKENGPLSRLDSFLDQRNLVTIGRRIKQPSISKKIKHPVILPGQGHISRLIAWQYHEKSLHQGKGITLNEIHSSGFRIIGCGTVISRLIHKCIRTLRAKFQEQKTADLPADRLTPAPPFTYCIVDYFRSWYVKEGRKDLKTYGVLFMCLVTRAIHLEVANYLEMDSYNNTLCCFICRRGPVRQMRSDNGSDFNGACRELKKALAEMDQLKLRVRCWKKTVTGLNRRRGT